MTLFRPVGIEELRLIAQSGWKSFPPRLPEQPIFYPVLNLEYAAHIADKWNTTSGSYAGFVTRFEVDDEFVKRYPPQIVGSRIHEELWVPAEELDEFNAQIQGNIEVVTSYYGEKFVGQIDEKTQLPLDLT